MNDDLVELSRFLSYVLRHRPDEIGVELHRWNAVSHRFEVFRNELFEFKPGGWVRMPAPA